MIGSSGLGRQVGFGGQLPAPNHNCISPTNLSKSNGLFVDHIRNAGERKLHKPAFKCKYMIMTQIFARMTVPLR